MSGFHSDEVSISLGGKTFILAWTMGAQRLVQTHTGKTLKAIFEEYNSDPNNADLAVCFLWACMRRHHKEMTFEQVQEMTDDLSLAQFAELANKVGECMTASAGPQEEAGNASPQKAGKSGASKGPTSNT
jgi:hypothetical protein